MVGYEDKCLIQIKSTLYIKILFILDEKIFVRQKNCFIFYILYIFLLIIVQKAYRDIEHCISTITMYPSRVKDITKRSQFI